MAARGTGAASVLGIQNIPGDIGGLRLGQDVGLQVHLALKDLCPGRAERRGTGVQSCFRAVGAVADVLGAEMGSWAWQSGCSPRRWTRTWRTKITAL